MSNSIVVAFDMDGTLLDGRLVLSLARLCNVEDKVKGIMNDTRMKGYKKSIAIARLWKGFSKDIVLEALSQINLNDNALNTIKALKEKGCIVGIISDSYTLASDTLARMLNMDFSIANTLEYDYNSGILTGRIHMPLGWQYINCTCFNSVCKRYHLERIEYFISSSSKYVRSKVKELTNPLRVAVGDSMNDVCMLSIADIGIAYRAKDGIENIANYSIDCLADVLDILTSRGLISSIG